MGIKMYPHVVAPTTRVFDMPERVIKFPFSQNAVAKRTGVVLQSGMWITDIFVQVTTAVGGSSLNVMLGSTGVDNLIDALSCAATGWFYRDALESEFLPSLYGVPGGNHVNTSAGLAIATTKTKVKSVNSIEYFIDGVRYVKAGTDNLFDLTGMNTTGGTKYNGAFLYLDAAGTASIVAATEGATEAAIAWPDPVVADKCCVGKVVVTKSDGAFTGGTTDLDAANVTATYTNAVSGTNSSTFGLSDRIAMGMLGMRLTSDLELYYSTSAHAVAGWVYVVVRGGFE